MSLRYSREKGYALVSVLFLIVILFVIGTIVMTNVTNSQGMVNVSGDIVAAQADGEAKLMIRLSEAKAAILALKNEVDEDEEEEITLEMVERAAAPFVDPGSAVTDEDKLLYTGIVSAKGQSGSITQTLQKKIEVTLYYEPEEPSEGGGTGGYAVVSQGELNLNKTTTVKGNIYAVGNLNRNEANIIGDVVRPGSNETNTLTPSHVNVVTIIAYKKVEADNKNSEGSHLKDSLGNIDISDLEVNNSDSFDQTVIFNDVTLHSGASLEVNGDLLINGDLQMETDSMINISGNLYVFGEMKTTGKTQIHSNQLIVDSEAKWGDSNSGLNDTTLSVGYIYVSGNVISKGRVQLNSDQVWFGSDANLGESGKFTEVIIFGDMYIRNNMNIYGRLIAKNIYVGSNSNGNLNGSCQFKLYSEYIAIGGGSSATYAELTGYLYSNNRVNINSYLNINALESGSEQEEDRPTKILFDEKNMIIR
ncbi:hypothetical protein V3851_11015 [Paenibacillus sp. M1]|uniref:Type 4 fimbrial biogenesis protein PilX N-terminal domain-containing protein n=1 Tax=Paenibacillus haidiansis TaxID=1574488 RepID=A0ABU7VSA7_9BACL